LGAVLAKTVARFEQGGSKVFARCEKGVSVIAECEQGVNVVAKCEQGVNEVFMNVFGLRNFGL